MLHASVGTSCVHVNLYILGEMNKNRQPNFLVVNNETPMTDIEGK